MARHVRKGDLVMVTSGSHKGKTGTIVRVITGEVPGSERVIVKGLNLRTKVTVEPSAGQVVVQRQTSFLFECFGEVARATSKPGEPLDDFTQTGELRRLGLGRRIWPCGSD